MKNKLNKLKDENFKVGTTYHGKLIHQQKVIDRLSRKIQKLKRWSLIPKPGHEQVLMSEKSYYDINVLISELKQENNQLKQENNQLKQENNGKMKIIDLFKIIANGEPIPRIIKHDTREYFYEPFSNNYRSIHPSEYLLSSIDFKHLNDEIEILERSEE